MGKYKTVLISLAAILVLQGCSVFAAKKECKTTGFSIFKTTKCT